MTDPRTRHTALAVCLAVVLLPLPIIFAATAYADPDGYDQKTDTFPEHPGLHISVTDATVGTGAPDTLTYSVSYDSTMPQGEITWTPDLHVRVQCVDDPSKLTTAFADSWTTPQGQTHNSTVTDSEPGIAYTVTTSCSATHPHALFGTLYLQAWSTNYEQWYILGQAPGGGSSMVACPDQWDLYREAWASWDGDTLTVLAEPDEDAWRAFTEPYDHLHDFPAADAWEVWISDGPLRTWDALPDEGIAFRDSVRASTGPAGQWTGLWLRPWNRDPSLVEDLDGDTIEDPYVVLIPQADLQEVEGVNVYNPPCLVTVPLGSYDPSMPPADTDTPTWDAPTAEPGEDGGASPDAPGEPAPDDHRDGCGLTDILGCFVRLFVPSQESIESIQADAAELLDVIPFSWAIDFGTWVDELTNGGCGIAECAIDDVAFDFSAITGQNTRLVLLDEASGANGGAADENVGPVNRILRIARPLMQFVVWAGFGLAVFRTVGRGGFSLGGDKA